MNVEKNIFKTYKPADRNVGRDNMRLETADTPGRNIDEQLVALALRNVLEPGMQVTIVSDETGPPDIAVNATIGIEVKGPEIHKNDYVEKVRKTIIGKLDNLRRAWRKEAETRGRRLHRYNECWIGVTAPLPVTWLRMSGMPDSAWNRRMEANRELFDTVIEECTKGSLQDPIVSRILLVFKTVFPYHTPLYVYNTKAFSPETCTPIPAFSGQPRESVVVEEALRWAGMELTTTEVGRSESKIYLSNEAKALIR